MRSKISYVFVAVVLALSVWVGLCRAQEVKDVIAKIPVTNAGVYYNLNTNDFEFTSTFKAIEFKGFDLNIGYASSESLVGSIGYNIVSLEKLGIKFPVLKDFLVDINWTAGWRRAFNQGSSEFGNGPGITLKWKW